MDISDFLKKMKKLSYTQANIRFYPYENEEKIYSRFLKRCFMCDKDESKIITDGWLRAIYSETNGLDLGTFYIVPFNNYFNQKPEAYDEFRSSWIAGHNNPNEIIGTEFRPFMTDGKTLIGFCTGLKDMNGNHFIAIANKKRGTVRDLIFIASSIYYVLDYISLQLGAGKSLTFSVKPQDWQVRDKELWEKYKTGQVLVYKLQALWNDDSVLAKQHTKI